MNRFYAFRSFLALIAALALAPLAWAGPDINPDEIKFDPGDSVFTTDTVTMTVTATSPEGRTLSYLWDFGDGSPKVATSTGTTTHVFAAEGDYLVDVEVNDGVDPAVVQAEIIEVVAPPASTSPGGTDLGSVEVNPDNGFSITVGVDAEGAVQLLLSDGIARATNEFGTTFSDNLGRTFHGSKPVHQFDAPGIFTATATASDTASGSEVGKVRKTLALGRRDLGLPPLVKNEPTSHAANVTKLKGKVNFTNTTKNDTMTVTWTIELPEGLDVSEEQVITLSLGNLTETIGLDLKGKGAGVTLFKKVTIKYPKHPKDNPVMGPDPATRIATVTAQILAAGLVSAGLDTEGISTRAKTTNPKIQVEMLLAGIAYASEAEVELKVAKNQATGIFGRVAR